MFSKASQHRLDQCDERLQEIFTIADKVCSCSIITGARNEVEQEEMYRTGRSKVRFPNSKHNLSPSLAVDAAPYPIDWNDRERFTLFAGLVLGIAHERGVKLRWGGNWAMDWNVKNNTFDDLVHFEIVE